MFRDSMSEGDDKMEETPDRSAILKRIGAVMSDQLAIDASSLDASTSISRDLDVDSLGSLQLLTALEDEFSIEIPDVEYQRVSTLGDLADMVARLFARGHEEADFPKGHEEMNPR